MKRDTTVFELIEKEHQRQLKGIELIASENFVSDEVMRAMGSWLTNKYAEGYPGKRYYGGCQVVEVTICAYFTGFSSSPAAISPAGWAMSTMKMAPTLSAISRIRA